MTEPRLGVAEEDQIASTSAGSMGVLTANSSAWSAGSAMPPPYTVETSDPQSHESGPAVPGAYGRPSAPIAAVTAARVSAGSTSSEFG